MSLKESIDRFNAAGSKLLAAQVQAANWPLTEAQLKELQVLAEAKGPLTRRDLIKRGCPGPKSPSEALSSMYLARRVSLDIVSLDIEGQEFNGWVITAAGRKRAAGETVTGDDLAKQFRSKR